MPVRLVWTIGHSTRSAEDFGALLHEHGINGLADIRTIPRSRRHPHFSREALEGRLHGDGMRYRHFPALGGLRKPRSDSANGAWKNAAFRGYADHMQTDEFAGALNDLLEFAGGTSVAVMCAEALWWRCHRMLVADALVAQAVDVRHIMSQRGRSSAQPHRLTPFARIQCPPDTSGRPRLSYPGLV